MTCVVFVPHTYSCIHMHTHMHTHTHTHIHTHTHGKLVWVRCFTIIIHTKIPGPVTFL